MKLAPPNPSHFWGLTRSEWGHFFTSSGFAGAAAVVGALVALLSVLVQMRGARRTAREERWWTTLMWVHERTFSNDKKVRNLDPDTALPMFQALQVQANGRWFNNIWGLRRIPLSKTQRLQNKIVGAIVAPWLTRTETHASPQAASAPKATEATPDATSEPIARLSDSGRAQEDFTVSRLRAAASASRPEISDFNEELLASVLETSQTDSPAARAALYERAVYDALTRAVDDESPVSVFRPPASLRPDALDPDMIVITDYGNVGVTVKWSAHPEGSRVAAAADRLRRAIENGDLVGGIVVTPTSLSPRTMEVFKSRNYVQKNIAVLIWDGQHAAPLLSAVRRVSSRN